MILLHSDYISHPERWRDRPSETSATIMFFMEGANSGGRAAQLDLLEDED
jgi:hypothetical protein